MTLAPGRFRRRQLREAGQAAALRFEDECVRGLFTAAYVACYRSRDQIRLPMDETGMIGRSLGQITAIRAAAAAPTSPVTALTATCGVPKRYRDIWTKAIATDVSRIPGAELAIVAGAGHYIHDDQPNR
ncbi:MAG TPA: hypothetical protein VI365_27210, partial [Trebonia sp.]